VHSIVAGTHNYALLTTQKEQSVGVHRDGSYFLIVNIVILVSVLLGLVGMEGGVRVSVSMESVQCTGGVIIAPVTLAGLDKGVTLISTSVEVVITGLLMADMYHLHIYVHITEHVSTLKEAMNVAVRMDGTDDTVPRVEIVKVIPVTTMGPVPLSGSRHSHNAGVAQGSLGASVRWWMSVLAILVSMETALTLARASLVPASLAIQERLVWRGRICVAERIVMGEGGVRR